VSDRWQDDEARARRVRAFLGDVVEARERLASAEEVDVSGLDAWMRRRQDGLVAGARKGLDAAIWMALTDRSAPPVDDVAAAAEVDVAHVEAVRARVSGR
jgi:hypothetical protein